MDNTGRNKWIKGRTEQGLTPKGVVCTIHEKDLGVVEIESSTKVCPSASMSENFLEVLEDWGCRWLWDSLRLYRDEN